MKFRYKTLVALLLCACALFAVSCRDTQSEDGTAVLEDLEALELSVLEGYVALGEYKALDIKLGASSKEDAVWDAIRANCDVKNYPSERVEYYFAQAKAQYEYYAEMSGIDYAQMLIELGKTEAELLSEAEQRAIDDVIFELVRRKENISLTESDKQVHFDKYVEKYVSDYGYTEEYVRENLSEKVYGSMLYDKVCEFLIANNNFN